MPFRAESRRKVPKLFNFFYFFWAYVLLLWCKPGNRVFSVIRVQKIYRQRNCTVPKKLGVPYEI